MWELMLVFDRVIPADMVNTRDVSNSGLAVGFSGSSEYHSYTWKDGVLTQVQGPGNVAAVGVNDHGELAGSAGPNQYQPQAGMWKSDGTFVGFGIIGGSQAINNT